MNIYEFTWFVTYFLQNKRKKIAFLTEGNQAEFRKLVAAILILHISILYGWILFLFSSDYKVFGVRNFALFCFCVLFSFPTTLQTVKLFELIGIISMTRLLIGY